MARIPAMTTGMTSSNYEPCKHCRRSQGLLLMIRSGRRTPMAVMPTPDFAVPYAAPKQVKTIADVHPIAPKKGYLLLDIRSDGVRCEGY